MYERYKRPQAIVVNFCSQIFEAEVSTARILSFLYPDLEYIYLRKAKSDIKDGINGVQDMCFNYLYTLVVYRICI